MGGPQQFYAFKKRLFVSDHQMYGNQTPTTNLQLCLSPTLIPQPQAPNHRVPMMMREGAQQASSQLLRLLLLQEEQQQQGYSLLHVRANAWHHARAPSFIIPAIPMMIANRRRAAPPISKTALRHPGVGYAVPVGTPAPHTAGPASSELALSSRCQVPPTSCHPPARRCRTRLRSNCPALGGAKE